MLAKGKLALLLITVVGLFSLGFMWKSAAAARDVAEQRLQSATEANEALAKWGTEQIRKLEEASAILTKRQRQATIDRRKISSLQRELQNVPASPCFDEPLPSAVIDSLQRAASTDSANSAAGSLPATPPAGTSSP